MKTSTRLMSTQHTAHGHSAHSSAAHSTRAQISGSQVIVGILEASQAVRRLRARERAERQIAATYSPAIGKYLKQTGSHLTAKLRRVASRIDAESAKAESQRDSWYTGCLVTEAAIDDLPPSLRSTETLLDEGLSEIENNILQPSTLALAAGYESGWKRALSDFRKLGLDLSDKSIFNVRNSGAARWVAANAATLVRRVTDESKSIIRGFILAGIREGKSYQKIAREIRRRFVDDSSFSARPRGPRHLRTRAELIAVTEIGNAYEEGTFRVAGRVHRRSPLEKRWITVGDERVSDMDIANAAMGWIRYSRRFDSGHDRPLSHPGCRCTVVYRTSR